MYLFRKFCPILAFLFWCNTATAQYAAIVIDADSGKVLQQVSATHRWFPASLTKVMTLYLTFAALKAGQLSLYDMAPVSSYAESQPNSKLGLQAGESIMLKDAIVAVISRSANDAAVVLAERVAGTEAQFAMRMTATAQALGMRSSRFFNATGLPHPQQVSSPRDLAILASHVRQDFKQYFPLFSTESFNFKGRNLPNINSFLKSYVGAQGMKTGFTCGSGYNLIAAAQRDGKHLIGVLLGATSRGERNQLMTAMLDQGFADYDLTDAGQNLLSLKAEDYSSAPYQLPAASCRYEDYTTITRHNNETTGTKYAGLTPTPPPASNFQKTSFSSATTEIPATQSTLKNWTVVLGAFNERTEAEAFNLDVRSKLDELANLGYPIVLQHETDGVNLWHALWTGLTGMNQASQVCKHLWESDIECSILPAEVIAAKDAPWR